MSSPRPPIAPGRLLLLLIGLNVLWAPVNFWVKLAAGDGLAGIPLAVARWSLLALILPGLLLSPAVRVRTGFRPLAQRQRVGAFAIGAVLFGPAHLLYYTSLPRTSSVEGTVLLTTAPLWTALLSYVILGERATPRRWIALIVAIFGAYVTAVGFGLPQVEGSHLIGNAMFFTGVGLECLGGVLAAKIARASSGIGTLSWQIVGAVPTLWLAALLTHADWPRPGGLAFLSLGYLVIFAGIVTFSAWYMLTERAPLSLMVLPIGLQPPIAAVLGALFLNEVLRVQVAVGGGLILVALVLGFVEPRRAAGRFRALRPFRRGADR